MEAMKVIANRQSCRSYTGEQITQKELQTILEEANASPIGMGKYEHVKLTVIQKPELLAKLDAAGARFYNKPEMHPLYSAPTVILVSSKILDTPQNPSPHCNAACIVENMALAATDLGLGNVYLLGVIVALGMDKDLCTELKVPEGFLPASALAVGKPAMPLKERDLTLSKIATDYLR